jgi:heme exporter protein C
VLRLGGSTIHPTILVPLVVRITAFTLLFLTLHLAAMRNEIVRRRLRTMLLMQADAAAGA